MQLIVTGRSSQWTKNPALFLKDVETSAEYAIISKPEKAYAIVMDKMDYDVTQPSIFVHTSTGYAYMHEPSANKTHHSIIMNSMMGSANIPENHNIDHINWIKTDNRRDNLRLATNGGQNNNRIIYNRIPPPAEISALGIPSLPKYMRWDPIELKFAVDMPDGSTISGTKKGSLSIVDKFRACAEKYMERLIQDRSVENEEFVRNRIRLANEYNAIVHAAYETDQVAFFDGPYFDVSELDSLITRLERIIMVLPPIGNGVVLNGPLNGERVFVYLKELDAIACFVKDKGHPPTLYDRRHHEVLREITWESDTLRVSPTKVLRTKYPTTFQKSKVPLAVFIARELEGIQVDTNTHVVVPFTFNATRQDIRVANLIVAPGSGQNYVVCGSPEPPVGASIAYRGESLAYLPKGVTVSKDGDKYLFSVRIRPHGDNKGSCKNEEKIRFKNMIEAAHTFEQRVIPIIEGNWASVFQNVRFVKPSVVPGGVLEQVGPYLRI